MQDRARALAEALAPAISDPRVVEAIASVPRERFVPRRLQRRAYDNSALPIACGQTISQPLVVARMCDVLELGPEDRVLEVGTGSGYHAAVLAQLAGHVWTVECYEELVRQAAANLESAGIANVTLIAGDGSRGHPAEAPYDAISVAAATPESALPALEAQLAPGGRLVAPVCGRLGERLVLSRRGTEQHGGDEVTHRLLEAVRFVPLLTGRHAASE
jgi:protein-L-isoaspartate(D-aspartate) O-methyltransferase